LENLVKLRLANYFSEPQLTNDITDRYAMKKMALDNIEKKVKRKMRRKH
jgi:hypothetical protein